MSGTDRGWAGTDLDKRGRRLQWRWRSAQMPGTLTGARCYGMSGTDVGHGATRYSVLCWHISRWARGAHCGAFNNANVRMMARGRSGRDEAG
eukprot:3067288-Rhodomonas_salina.2